MRKTIATLVIALSAIGFAGTAQAETPVVVSAPASVQDSFDQDGYTYVYTVIRDAKGTQTISGTRYPDATPFTLKVKGDRVSGEANGQDVAFHVADAAGAARDSEINVIAKAPRAN